MNRKDLIVILFLSLSSLLYFYSIVFLDQVVYAGDNISLFIPYKTFLIEQMKKGQIPLWNPYIFSGASFIGDISVGMFYISNLLYFFAQPLHALSYSIVIHTLGTGISMYFLIKKYQQGFLAAVLAALLWMFGGTLIQLSQNISAFEIVVWLPVSTLLIEKYFEEEQKKYLVIFVLSLVLQLFAGHIQFFYYNFLFYVAYTCFVVQKSFREKLFFLILSSVFLILVGGIQLLPFLEYSQHSTRPLSNYKYATASVPSINLIHLLLANSFGTQKDGTSWGAQASVLGYVGILPFIIIALSRSQRWGTRQLFFFTVMVVTLLTSIGHYSPLYYAAFHVLPFFSRFRSPTSILTIYTFAVCVLVGLSLQNFSNVIRKIGNRNELVIILTILGISTFLMLTLKLQLFTILSSLELLHLSVPIPLLQKFIEYPTEKLRLILALWIDNIITIQLLITAFLFILMLGKRVSITRLTVCIIFLCTLDILYFGRNAYMTAPSHIFKTPATINNFFESFNTYRIYTVIDPPEKPVFGDKNFYLREALKQYQYLKPNTNMLVGLRSIDGYASVVDKDYVKLVAPLKPLNPTSLNPLDLNSSVLNELSVRYILVSDKLQKTVSSNPQYQKRVMYFSPTLKQHYFVYENKNFIPLSPALDTSSFNDVINIDLTTLTKKNKVEIKKNKDKLPLRMEVLETQHRSLLYQQKYFYYGLILSSIGSLFLVFYLILPFSFFSGFKKNIQK